MPTAPPVLPRDEPPEYRKTWLERAGDESESRIKAIGYGLTVFGLIVGACFFSMAQGGSSMGLAIFLLVFLCAAIVGALVGFLANRFASGSGAVMKAFTLPTGNSTPYEEQFSYQESLIARGELDHAFESFEAIIAERPDAVSPRLKAAEHYAARNRNPERAAELFRDVRRIAGVTPRHAIYATSRLIDLYNGPLDDPGRALVEMRRVIEEYPDSPIAKFGRNALPEMKARARERAESQSL